ncbi:MAG: hypothetical protein JST87_04040 [Bacteroidetes bacterium]|nr:hypothetical protein [Bacteroidota bacterium]MBS1933412.1 hypothetical protein [Bacteroidota bacterium]
MKPVFKTIVKAISVAATGAFLIAVNPANSNANPVKGSKEKFAAVNESQVDVKYVGSNTESFVFRVEFNNPSAQSFFLVVKNDEGDIIYSQKFNDAHFSKTIHLLKEENETTSIHPTFEITAGSQQVKRSFEISRKYTEDVLVTKL